MNIPGIRSLQSIVLALALVVSSCALPWKSYPVSSAITGRVVRGGTPVGTGRVRLQVRSHDNATLGTHREHALGADGSFSFEPISLKIAGQEYDKSYFLLLYWIDEGAAVTLWRADYSRSELGGALALECELERQPMQGPPCLFVGDARDQPWLLAAGARDYRELCARCHGEDGHRGGPDAAALPISPPDLTKIAARRGGVFPFDEMAVWIDGRSPAARAHGTREMPVWGVRLAEEYVPGGFTEARIRNRIDILVEYLETLQER